MGNHANTITSLNGSETNGYNHKRHVELYRKEGTLAIFCGIK